METNSEYIEKIRKRVNYQTSKSAGLGDISTTSDKSIPDPFHILRETENPLLSELTDALVYWCQKTFGQDLFIEAHKEFQTRSGTVFYDDDSYHERMGYFLDYLVFEKTKRPEKNIEKITFLERFLSSIYLQKSGLSNKTVTFLNELKSFKHSIFLTVKSNSKKLVIKDLFDNKKIEIQGQGFEFFQQFSKPIIFQGFIFNFANCNHLSKGLVLHDREANKYIQKSVRKALKSESYDSSEELFSLGKQNITFARLKNVNAKTAYERR